MYSRPSTGRSESPSRPSTSNSNKLLAYTVKSNVESAYFTHKNNQIKNEFILNQSKRRYNRSCGAQTEMSEVLTGKGVGIREPLYPQKASHHQALMISGKLKMPDANATPPFVPQPKKWLGNDLGWQE